MIPNIEGHFPASSQGHNFASWVRPLIFRSKVRKIRPCEAHKNELHEVFFHTLFRYDHHIPCFFHFVELAESPWKNFVTPRALPHPIPPFPHYSPIISIHFTLFHQYTQFSSIIFIIFLKREKKKREEKRRWSGSIMVCWSMPWNCQKKRRKKKKKIERKVWKREEMRRWLENINECPFERKWGWEGLSLDIKILSVLWGIKLSCFRSKPSIFDVFF